MSNIIIPPRWAIDPREAASEEEFHNRRAFMKKAAAAGLIGLGGGPLAACAEDEKSGGAGSPVEDAYESPVEGAERPGGYQEDWGFAGKYKPAPAPGLYPAKRNEAFKLDRPVTAEKLANGHNNFYEFANTGRNFQQVVGNRSKNYAFRPWEVEVGGLCEKPRKFDIDEIEKIAPLEERLYRFRCVETWSMAVPWTGYSLSKLLEKVEPKPEAKYVRFVSLDDPNLPGVATATWYTWPYFEALRLDEAMNELCMVVTGIYGKPLKPQHGAPVRIIAPWKYGYKSPKSIIKIELTDNRPDAFWNKLLPQEYGFLSNVNPNNPHPRWSQASEWTIPSKTERRPTQIFNGYGDFVADMYPNEPTKPGKTHIL